VRIELTGAQRLALLVHPPPQREVLGDADLDLGVVRDGVQAGDAPAFTDVMARLRVCQPVSSVSLWWSRSKAT
jgi:hypothetical protein